MKVTLTQQAGELAIGATAVLRIMLTPAASGGTGGGGDYTLPAATTKTMGGVMVGANLTVSSGTLSLSKANAIAALGYTPQDPAGLAKVATTGAYADLSGTPAGYTLPQATAKVLGGVMVGSNIAVAAGVISIGSAEVIAALGLTPVSAAGAAAAAPVQSVAGRTGAVTLAAADVSGLSKVATTGDYGDLSGTPTAYTLPQATGAVLGGVVVGSNLTVSSGTLSLSKANVTGALGYTPQDPAGLAKVATTGAYADLSGTPTAYTLPQATGAVLGGVIVGSNLTVSSGTLSLSKFNVTGALGLTPVDTAGAAAAAPVQSVGGATGAVALTYGMTVDFSQGAVPVAGTITLDGGLASATTIADVTHKVGSAGGTIDFAVQIVSGGTPTSITGLSAVSSTGSSYTTTKATAANKGAAGDQLQLVISKVTGTPDGAVLRIHGTVP